MLVKKRPPRTLAELAHPLQQIVIGLVSCREEQVSRRIAPTDANDDHADAIRPELLGKRFRLAKPSAHKVPAWRHRPLLVDGAMAFDEKVAMLAGVHRMAANLARGPAFAARRARSTGPARGRA